MRRFAHAILLALALASMALPLVRAQEIVISVTNTTAYVWFRNVELRLFNSTFVRISWLNVSTVRVSYSCVFSWNYSAECRELEILANGSLEALFLPNASICRPEYGYCISYVDIPFSGEALNLSIVECPTGQLLDSVILRRPAPFASPALGADLLMLVPLALLIGMTARASLKGCGLGAILYGIAVTAMTVMGLVPRSAFFISVLAIAVGGVMLYLSR